MTKWDYSGLMLFRLPFYFFLIMAEFEYEAESYFLLAYLIEHLEVTPTVISESFLDLRVGFYWISEFTDFWTG
jgi:hypothetical protein